METGKNLQLINPTTPGRDLAGYVASANSIAVLTPEQEKELANQYYYENNVDAARQLVLAHLRFVVHMAKSFSVSSAPTAHPGSAKLSASCTESSCHRFQLRRPFLYFK